MARMSGGISRRSFLGSALSACGAAAAVSCGTRDSARRPNILLAISDDQSHLHAGAYGSRFVRTPAFDRVAREGVLFRNAFAPSPGCSPTRAALLTGRHIWQIEQAGTHASSFPARYLAFPDLLEQAGYFAGYTAKGWGPGRWQDERPRNPAGTPFSDIVTDPPYEGISKIDYAANFEAFLTQRPPDRPFVFWYGGQEPHRVFHKGAGLNEGKSLEEAEVPPFLPDTPEIRADLLDYAVEIEWFDKHLGRMLAALEQAGELDNTLIIVTSDNGMAFPRAKANLYEFGIHMPLAVRWGARAPAGRTVDDLVGFVDLTATILDVAGAQHPGPHLPSGRSIRNILESRKQGLVDPAREAVFGGRERHSSSRLDNLGYPGRYIRTVEYLYVRNFAPERWPAGDPQKYEENGRLGPMHGGYHDIDACPTLDFLIEHQRDPVIGKYFHLAVDKRPAEELFDIRRDPGCLDNLAAKPEFEETRRSLSNRLEAYLRETGAPRATGNGDIFETYPRYSPIRRFPRPS
jgi:N-sulfoglucosamine sulfohydrolase